jgi:hypothetical protein
MKALALVIYPSLSDLDFNRIGGTVLCAKAAIDALIFVVFNPTPITFRDKGSYLGILQSEGFPE